MGDYMVSSDFHLNKSWFDRPLEFECISLIQIGRMFCKSTTVIDSHIHTDLYELTIVTDGKALIYTNNIATSVKKGDIYLSHPGDIHKIEADFKSPLKYDFFAFRINDTNFKKDFETISREYAMPTTRVFEDKQISWLVGNVINELSEVVGLSYGYLSTIFKNTTHSSLSEYYRAKKLDSARFLLQEQKFTIPEISELLNYTSVYAFSKAFKNYYGLSPKNFQLRH